jgi:hypothetical protein
MNLTRFIPFISASTLLLAVAARGQDTNFESDSGFFHDWFANVTKIQSEQPHWITPMTMVTPPS